MELGMGIGKIATVVLQEEVHLDLEEETSAEDVTVGVDKLTLALILVTTMLHITEMIKVCPLGFPCPISLPFPIMEVMTCRQLEELMLVVYQEVSIPLDLRLSGLVMVDTTATCGPRRILDTKRLHITFGEDIALQVLLTAIKQVLSS